MTLGSPVQARYGVHMYHAPSMSERRMLQRKPVVAATRPAPTQHIGTKSDNMLCRGRHDHGVMTARWFVGIRQIIDF